MQQKSLTLSQLHFQDTLEKYYTTESQRNAVTLSWDHVMAQVMVFVMLPTYLLSLNNSMPDANHVLKSFALEIIFLLFTKS